MADPVVHISGLAAELIGEAAIMAELSGPQIREARIEFATNEVVPYAKSISPVDTGTFVESIGVKTEGNEVMVGSDDEIANLIEYGSVHNEEHAVFARTQAHFNGLGHGGDTRP
jgi:hypothetical protein